MFWSMIIFQFYIFVIVLKAAVTYDKKKVFKALAWLRNTMLDTQQMWFT